MSRYSEDGPPRSRWTGQSSGLAQHTTEWKKFRRQKTVTCQLQNNSSRSFRIDFYVSRQPFVPHKIPTEAYCILVLITPRHPSQRRRSNLWLGGLEKMWKPTSLLCRLEQNARNADLSSRDAICTEKTHLRSCLDALARAQQASNNVASVIVVDNTAGVGSIAAFGSDTDSTFDQLECGPQ